MLRSRSPECLWDFCCVYALDIQTMISHTLPQLEGHTPYEHFTGNTPDISEYLYFSWYAPVWYYENKDWPEQKATLGRWLCLSLLNQASFPNLLPFSYVLFLCTINMHLKWNANVLYHIHQRIPGISF